MADKSLKGLRVLLVEDQMIVAMQIEDILREAGCEVIGPIATPQSAITVAQSQPLDAAVLDINLDGEKIFPVAEELRRRGIPFILATGYSESTLPEQWREQPRLSKPFRREQLEQLLGSVVSRRA